MTTLTHLACSVCARRYDAGQPHQRCECGGALLACYDLEAVKHGWNRDWIPSGPDNMWRYAPVLPVSKPASILSLGEGLTPMVKLRRRANVWYKDEGMNPAGSARARGLSAAISMAREFGFKRVMVISATGNAASATAAYAAAAGLEADLYLHPNANADDLLSCHACGARVHILAAGTAPAAPEGVYDLTARNEPYRMEGEKTIGYEAAEEFRWQLPDVILCPHGGLTYHALRKAFDEMEAIGWIGEKRPRIIPNDPGITPREALQAGVRMAREEGLLPSPEVGASLVMLDRLHASGDVAADARILIINPCSSLKHTEAYSTRFPLSTPAETDKLGGLITPR